VFLVNRLVATVNGAPVSSPLVGYGLTSANGAIVAANASVDTLAHELGHNLGLRHVDGQSYDNPNDLMRSVGRNVPASGTDPRIGASIDLLSGAAVNDQVRQVNQPLYTVDLASADCKTGGLNCVLTILANGTGSESLIGVKLRWLDASVLASTVIDTPLHGVIGLPVGLTEALGCDNTGYTTHTLANPGGRPGEEIDVSLPKGCLTPGLESSLAFEFPGGPTPNVGYYQPPFSAEFDFADGTTSTGLFDASLGAVSPLTVTVGGVTPDPLAPDQGIDFVVPPASVPEPESNALLLVGLVALAVQRYRRVPAPVGVEPL
jgi:hypothetical protein